MLFDLIKQTSIYNIQVICMRACNINPRSRLKSGYLSFHPQTKITIVTYDPTHKLFLAYIIAIWQGLFSIPCCCNAPVCDTSIHCASNTCGVGSSKCLPAFLSENCPIYPKATDSIEVVPYKLLLTSFYANSELQIFNKTEMLESLRYRSS